MKQIINRKLYNTETAENISDYSFATPRDFEYLSETLYRKRTGEFFLHGKGGPRSKYSETIGQNSWTSGEQVISLSMDEAMTWMEKHADPDDYIRVFGEPEE